MRRASSGACAREWDHVSGCAFSKGLKMGGRAACLLLDKCLLQARVACGAEMVLCPYLRRCSMPIGCLGFVSCKTVQMSARGVYASWVTFHENVHVDGIWKVLDHLKSAHIAVNVVTFPTLLKGLTAHTHQRDITRAFDLELEMEVGDALFPCVVEGCNQLEHVGPLPPFLNGLRCMSSKVSTPIFGAMIKSSGQMGNVAKFVRCGSI